MGYLIIIVVLFGLMWFFLIRPQRRKSESQMAMQDQLQVGDEIITAGGLHATVRSVEGEVLEIEIAPGTVVRLDRRAVAAVASAEAPEETESEGETEEERQPVSPGES